MALDLNPLMEYINKVDNPRGPMQILVQTLGSSALQSIVFNTQAEEAEVTFAKGGKYTYAIQRGKDYASADDIAQAITIAQSAGAKFNQLVKDGVLTRA